MKKVLISFVVVLIFFLIFISLLLLPTKNYSFSDRQGTTIFNIKIPLLYYTSIGQGENILQIGIGKASGSDVLNFIHNKDEKVADCQSLYEMKFVDGQGEGLGYSENRIGKKLICAFDLEKDLYSNSSLGYIILPDGKGVVSVIYSKDKKILAEMMIKTIN